MQESRAVLCDEIRQEIARDGVLRDSAARMAPQAHKHIYSRNAGSQCGMPNGRIHPCK